MSESLILLTSIFHKRHPTRTVKKDFVGDGLATCNSHEGKEQCTDDLHCSLIEWVVKLSSALAMTTIETDDELDGASCEGSRIVDHQSSEKENESLTARFYAQRQRGHGIFVAPFGKLEQEVENQAK